MSSPAAGSATFRNNEPLFQLTLWAKKDGCGEVFDSSGGFVLQSGATRSPDASQVESTGLVNLTEVERHRLLRFCLPLVVDLCSQPVVLTLVQGHTRGVLVAWVVLRWEFGKFGKKTFDSNYYQVKIY